ncbi:hypothetical protein OYT1_ch2443 [Ferriphaselus amnicola]|uniref:Uncharacterized protein n=1 Tax=Ferriphaselus amnicola TaxID=1188319 RepID=A0A2Z6GEF3_9PROT|nr:hypothetical protein OYT1_ch2443 [Ferriphaselus amnicola]
MELRIETQCRVIRIAEVIVIGTSFLVEILTKKTQIECKSPESTQIDAPLPISNIRRLASSAQLTIFSE